MCCCTTKQSCIISPHSLNYARFVWKGIACFLSFLGLLLPSYKVECSFCPAMLRCFCLIYEVLNTWVRFALHGSYRSSNRSMHGYIQRWEEAPHGRIQVEDDQPKHDKSAEIWTYYEYSRPHDLMSYTLLTYLSVLLQLLFLMIRGAFIQSLPCRTSSADWVVHTCRYLLNSLPYKRSTVNRGNNIGHFTLVTTES